MGDDQQVCVVTGATDGIGRSLALALARHGAQVFGVGRSLEKGTALARALEAAQPNAEHRFIAADLSRMADVACIALDLRATTPRVDVLVHCAGIISGRPIWTDEGVELNFAVNYLSRFLLTRLLEPALLQSSDPRVIIIAGPGTHPDLLDVDDLQLKHRWSGSRAFRRAQFANDPWAQALQHRHPKLTVIEVLPGLVRSNIFRAAVGLPRRLRIAGLVARLIGSSTDQAAQVPFYYATSPQAKRLGGGAFGPKMKPISLKPTAKDPARQTELWDASERLLARWLAMA